MILHWYSPGPNHQSFRGTPCSPLSWGRMEGLKAEGLGWGLLGDSKGVQNRESILCMLPVATAQLLQASITFTNTYINTLHTIVGLGGRLPTEAQLTVMSQNSRKGARLPEMCSMCSLLPKSPPFSFSGSSLSSTESCRRWVWRLETWAAGSWAGCADQSHSGHPAVGGGAAAGSEAAGGPA